MALAANASIAVVNVASSAGEGYDRPGLRSLLTFPVSLTKRLIQFGRDE